MNRFDFFFLATTGIATVLATAGCAGHGWHMLAAAGASQGMAQNIYVFRSAGIGERNTLGHRFQTVKTVDQNLLTDAKCHSRFLAAASYGRDIHII